MGGMKGADILVVSNSSGTWTASDYYATAYIVPALDAQQDWSLTSTPIVGNGSTTFTAKRLLNTCDTFDRVFSAATFSTSTIWAFGSATSLAYHGTSNRGNAQVQFIASAAAEVQPADPSDLQTIEVRMNNITIPSNLTTYQCTHAILPNATKYHVIRFDGLPQTKYVHHMLMYGCSSWPPTASVGDSYSCAGMDTFCQKMGFGWVPGVTTVLAPPVAGWPIGTSDSTYFALQVHYNNPNLDAGVVDSSGFRLYYTKQLRANDIGILTLGTGAISIPPGNASFENPPGICPSSCTSTFPTDLTLIKTGMHMHLTGKSISTRLIRNGTEMAPLGNRSSYNFNYQGGYPVDPRTPMLMRGDTLMTTCTYDTSGLTNITKFGEASQNEMCFDFLQYYPAMTGIDLCVGVSAGLSTCTTTAIVANFSASNGTAPLPPK
ncbi:PHM/PNGase F domain-containing protein [Blyttiomyces helicus]|uniref:PHM/PNGase F domain-containing protein n=1 Tax=Blyttiomyces helicus TaxID=388810 RepID=A0A4P9VUH9_9FUNG|nr:PHM/PNGase F domain-containing protein [Blyttiomyces helicus]|eukprot:RKO83244.1 PHM/PNGase F domain-containing protein [Blyttiomyces helicus]